MEAKFREVYMFGPLLFKWPSKLNLYNLRTFVLGVILDVDVMKIASWYVFVE